MRFYQLGAAVWKAKIDNEPERALVISNMMPLIERETCPYLMDATDRAKIADRTVPAAWACAADKIAEAEKLLGERK